MSNTHGGHRARMKQRFLEHGLDNLTHKDLREMLLFANAAAALVIQRKGALKVMPGKEEIWKQIEKAD